MSLLKKTSRQSVLYLSFQVIGIGISLISFPIMTRIFSVEEYGNLSLINAVLAIMIAIAKCGIATSFIRYFSTREFEETKVNLYSSAFGGTILVSFTVVLIYFILIFIFKNYIDSSILTLLVIGGALVLFRNLGNLFGGFFRAEEKIITLNIFALLYKVGSMISGILLCLFLIKGLPGYFIGVIISEAILTIYIGLLFYKKKVLEMKSFSFKIFMDLYYYGFPLLFFEISSLINDYSDRFLIKYFLGSAQLGVYSVGYNLSTYVQGLITAPLWMAAFPIYTKLWDSEGKEKTAKFLADLLKYYFCLGILIAFGISQLSNELITILATPKFRAASTILPFVVGSIIIYGSTHITGAGFYLLKQTKKIAFYTIISAIFNIAINLYFIPKYNILGAAYSTALSFLLLTYLITRNSQRLLKITWPIKDILFYIMFAIVMIMAMNMVQHENRILNLFIKAIFGFFIYSGFLIIYDKKIRNHLFTYAHLK